MTSGKKAVERVFLLAGESQATNAHRARVKAVWQFQIVRLIRLPPAADLPHRGVPAAPLRADPPCPVQRFLHEAGRARMYGV